MRLSVLIEKLQELKSNHGELNVLWFDNENGEFYKPRFGVYGKTMVLNECKEPYTYGLSVEDKRIKELNNGFKVE